MKTRGKTLCVCAGGAVVLVVTLRAVSFPGVFFQGSVSAIPGAAVLGLDPNDPNYVTSIWGYVGLKNPAYWYPAGEPNYDANYLDECARDGRLKWVAWEYLSSGFAYALQDGEVRGAGVLGGPPPPYCECCAYRGYYTICGLQTGVYDVCFKVGGAALYVVEDVEFQGGRVELNLDPMVFTAEGRISGTVTGPGGQPPDPNRAYVWTRSGSDGLLLMVNPDAQGDYVIKNLPEGTYTVSAASGMATFTPVSDVPVSAGQTTSGVHFAAAGEGSISGRVTDSTGAPPGPNDVLITLDCGADGKRGACVDENGYYLVEKVPAGTFTVTAFSVNYTFPAAPNVVVVAGEETSGVDIQAVPEGRIAGCVFEPDGQTPIADAFVWVEPVPQGAQLAAPAFTDADGFYVVSNLAPGDYTVKASHLDDPNEPNIILPVAEATAISVTEGQTTEPVNLTAPTGVISGSVSPAVGGTRVIAEQTSVDDSWRTSIATPDAGGAYSIPYLPPGTYRVRVEAAGYFAPTLSDVEVTQGETTGHNFALTTAGAISGRVTDGSGPIVGAIVTALDSEIDPNLLVDWGAPGTTTDPNGDYVLEHLAPAASYTVYVEAEDYVGDSTIEVTVTGGQTTPNVDFSLGTTGGAIAGTVYESDGVTPIEDAFVSCYGPGLTAQSTLTDSAGQYQLELMLPGSYVVTAAAEDFEPASVSDVNVSAGSTTEGVDFQLEPPP